MLLPSLLILLLPLVSSIFHDHDFSSSSESHEGRKHSHGGYGGYGGGGGGGGGRPKPRPPPKSKCQNGWKFFQRPTGGWCMKVFRGRITQADAETRCSGVGATLSGLQNTAEINWVVSSTLQLISPDTSGTVWIGTKRRPECYVNGLTATCTKTSSFYWTDHSTTGIEGMIFQVNEPSGELWATPNCALMLAAHTPVINAAGTFYSGQMDDISCECSASFPWAAGSWPRQNKAFVCGKESSR